MKKILMAINQQRTVCFYSIIYFATVPNSVFYGIAKIHREYSLRNAKSVIIL
jgi:hypothetical protein